VPIAVAVEASDNLGVAACRIVGAASSEPDNGLGDGDTANDVVITGPLTLQLRAERAGGGNGKTYTITVRCTDAAGNAASGMTIVLVPKSQGPSSRAGSSGRTGTALARAVPRGGTRGRHRGSLTPR
jgi:uncharacterized protein